MKFIFYFHYFFRSIPSTLKPNICWPLKLVFTRNPKSASNNTSNALTHPTNWLNCWSNKCPIRCQFNVIVVIFTKCFKCFLYLLTLGKHSCLYLFQPRSECWCGSLFAIVLKLRPLWVDSYFWKCWDSPFFYYWSFLTLKR